MKECKWHLCFKDVTNKEINKQFCSIKCKNKFGAQKSRMKIKMRALEYKGGKCEACGYSGCVDAFDFHHKDPGEKDFNIGSGNTRSWDKIEPELDKCLLLCANCHRTTHYNMKLTRYINDEILKDMRTSKLSLVKSIKVGRVKKINLCIDCDTKIGLYSKRCNSCACKAKSKIDWPSDEALSKLVWEKPRSELSKELGVSDRAIAKRCTAKSISQPGRGYWAKLRSNT